MRTECSRNCWIAGGVAGLLVWLAIGLFGSAGWGAGLLLGLLAAWFLGSILVWGVCKGAGGQADNEALLAGAWHDEPFTPTRRDAGANAPLDSRAVIPTREGGPRQRIVAGAGPDAPVRAAAARTEGAKAEGAKAEEDTRAEDAVAGDRAEASDPAHIQPAPGSDAQVAHPSVAPVDGSTAEDTLRPDSEAEALAMKASGLAGPQADAEAGADPLAPEGGITPVAKARKDEGGKKGRKTSGKAAAFSGAGNGGRVMTLTAAGDGDAEGGEVAETDDLTRIRGVGAMLQSWLAGYGITRFDQIAAWDDADVARYAGMMGRLGHRIREEDWVGQARQLAGGGEAAHGRAADGGEPR